MYYYNTKEWFRPLLQITSNDTVRKLLPTIVVITLITTLIVYLEVFYFQLSKNSILSNLTIMHSLLGFAISMVLVFRTNSAYDRWWEGRKLWGSLVNNCRNLSVKLHTMLPENDIENRQVFKDLISTFPKELRLHLLKDTTKHALDDETLQLINANDPNVHMPALISFKIQSRLQHLYKNGHLNGEQLYLLNAEVQSLLDICGACERIKNTPIPYSYSAFIKKFIAIYVISLPMGFAFTLSWLAIPVVTFIFYVLASLELIAEEIEDPFGLDANDLPLEKMSKNIANHVEKIFDYKAD